MARLVFREFDASKPTYARRKFVANGRRFAPNDLFDWRKMAVSPRRAKQMFDAGWIKHDESVEITVESNKPPAKALEPVVITESDNLDEIDDMKELRRIADEIGAPYKVSKADQRQAIRDHRDKEND